jgi:hypothetical protein
MDHNRAEHHPAQQGCNDGGCQFVMGMVAGVRLLSKQLNITINSERSRLSGSAIEFATILSAGLSPYLNHFSHSSCLLYLDFVLEQIQCSPGT